MRTARKRASVREGVQMASKSWECIANGRNASKLVESLSVTRSIKARMYTSFLLNACSDADEGLPSLGCNTALVVFTTPLLCILTRLVGLCVAWKSHAPVGRLSA